MQGLLLVLLFIVASLQGSLCSEEPTVEIQQGKLRGSVFNSSHSHREYFGFTGIPYAKAPLGNLRFKAPQPAEPWTGVWDATSERNICIQISFVNRVYEGHEDCLYINVYTPQLPTLTTDLAPMPVMVYFHCGGFTFGSGNSKLQGPEYLVDAGVILVTLNYRLGPFGSSDGFAVGTAKHCKFWRRPQESHHLWTQRRGCQRPVPHAVSYLSQLLGQNASSSDDAETLQFLQSVPPEKIFEMATENLLPENERDPLGFSLPFLPTKENVYEGGEEVFLPDEPQQLILQGKVAQVPYATGFASDVYFKYPAYQAVQLQTASSTSPVYFFQFDYVGRYGFRKAGAGFADLPGAFHGEELGYMFSVQTLNDLKLAEDEPEVQMMHKVVKMWTDFARTGNPTPDSELNIKWLPYTKENHNYLSIDEDLTMGTDLDKDRMHFWEQLHN
ncbi:hypothetical protein C0J52_10742 [Blattella germanica]|nr:hypothetical protein C0J52_10742 [Blattella germanica]